MRPSPALLAWTVGLAPAICWATERTSKAPDIAPVGAGSVAQVALALLFILVLIVGVAWLLRRLGQFQSGGGNAIRVLGGQSVGARERVVLVQVGETQLLLGVAPGRVQTLHVLEKPIPVEPRGAGGENFARRLSQAVRQRNGQ